MDSRALVGKTLFFIALVVFVAVFTLVFGEGNALVGVVIVVLALMMMRKDMSARPSVSLLRLACILVTMAVAAHVSLMDPFLGLAVNIAMVVAIVFLTVQDLVTPLHFPFLLGYAFMLSTPVSTGDLPVRILALVIGAVLVVGLNVLMRRKGPRHVCHESLASICAMVRGCADSVSRGEEPDRTGLDSLCFDVDARLRDRLHDGALMHASDRVMLDSVVSLRMVGRMVCDGRADPGAVMRVMDSVGSHERGEVGLDDVRRTVDEVTGGDVDIGLVSSLRTLCDCLERLSSDEHPVMSKPIVRTRLRESFRTDSMVYTFAVRMSLLFAMWAFIWQYWHMENAVWLLYTTVALVQPYVDGAWLKSAMRVVGTLVGSLLFIIVMYAVGGDVAMLGVVLLVLNYVYMVLDPKRYDVMMVFITASALMVAAMASPSGDVVVERVAYILFGVLAATLANHIVLPYRLRDEDLDLGRRYVEINRRMVSSLGSDGDDTALLLEADSISRKLRMNNSRDADPDMDRFLQEQDSLCAECGLLRRTISSMGEVMHHAVADVLSGRDVDPCQLDDTGREVVDRVRDLHSRTEDSVTLLGRMAVGL